MKNKLKDLYKDFEDKFTIRAFFNRMQIFPVKFEKKLLILLAVWFVNCGIGGMILIGYYLQWLANKTNQTDLSVNWICYNIWQFGIFSTETIHKFWDKQKVERERVDSSDSDNLIDYATAVASFLHTEIVQ